MDIKVLASGSKGNSYLISDGNTPLLIEAGIPYKRIQQDLNFKTSEIAGCLVSHSHADHSKAVADLLKAGIDIYASYETFDALLLDGHHRAYPIKPLQPFNIGTWAILPFETQHDCLGALGFLLASKTGEKVLFITDSYYCKFKFTGLNYILIECNYALDILNKNLDAGRVPEALKKRVLTSHFSLENVKGFLKANDLTQVRQIHLLHLSDDNSDAERFRREIEALTGKPVYVAGESEENI